MPFCGQAHLWAVLPFAIHNKISSEHDSTWIQSYKLAQDLGFC